MPAPYCVVVIPLAENFHNTIRKSLGALAPGKWREVDAAERVAVFT